MGRGRIKGLALARLGKHAEAVAAYERALQIQPDSYETMTNKGGALFQLGRYEEAQKLLMTL